MDVLFPPKPKWFPSDMPSLEGKVSIVTGGNVGIGRETVLQLMLKGSQVFMFSRTPAKAEAAMEQLRAQVKEKGGSGTVQFIKCDLGSFKSIKESVKEFSKTSTKLDYLFASAGVMGLGRKDKTSDGLDIQLGTNAVGHHLLIKLLIPTLLETAKASKEKNPVRVCITSSELHSFSSGFDKNDPELEKGIVKYFSSIWSNKMYGHSKLANILDAKAWQDRYGSQGIVFTSCHPGTLRSEITRNSLFFKYIMAPLFFYPVELGAYTQLYANCSEDAPKLGGQYLTAWARIGTPQKVTGDKKMQEEWWNWAEEQVAKAKL